MGRTILKSVALTALAAAAAHATLTRPPSPDKLLRASGVTLLTGSGHVELLDPRNPDYISASIPLPLGVGTEVKTGMLSKAGLQFEDGSSVVLGSHTRVKVGSPTPELCEGRVTAQAAPRFRVTLQTAAVPVVVRGGSFSIQIPGRGKGRMGALGSGRAAAGQLIAFQGLVEVQAPMGTIRPTQLPLTLHEGTVVETSANSYAVVQFKDGARIKLRADSTAAIENEHRATVAAGAVDVFIPAKSELEVRTVDRESTIRGASFLAAVAPAEHPTQRLADEPIAPPVRAAAPAASEPEPGSEGWDGASPGGR